MNQATKKTIYKIIIMATAGTIFPMLGGCSLVKPQQNIQPIVVAPKSVVKKHTDYMLYQPLKVSNNTTQSGRYQTVANQASLAQENPLLSIAQYKFPPSVNTIGQAINQILMNTGYQLASKEKLPETIKILLKKPLPASQRDIGPIRIADALNLLVGKQIYSLLIDPVHRLVNYKINPDFESFAIASSSVGVYV
tara:strand:- start:7311 stop:7892 length:582 start_codon:yes stop_codon:yes gene_type:complete